MIVIGLSAINFSYPLYTTSFVTLQKCITTRALPGTSIPLLAGSWDISCDGKSAPQL